uniref:Toll/interleukin-1 receptor domain-containing adapter protein n=1 Tax=Callorhinchus milii TaxID=7868 RepID=V9L7M0_CALMI
MASNIDTVPTLEYDFSLWYCEMDEEVALTISRMLHQKGYKGFVERQDQVMGGLQITEVTDVIQQSKSTIVLLSKSSLDSNWCWSVSKWNFQHYIEQGRKVIPVYVDIQKEQSPCFLRHLTGLGYGTKFFRKRLLDSLETRKKTVKPR